MMSLGLRRSKFNILLWDTAGQEKFRTITRTYFKGAHGAVIVYDITNRSSYSNIHSWIEEIDKYAALGITKLLIGNKCDDQMNRKVTYEEGTEISNMYKMNFIETSAKSTNLKKIKLFLLVIPTLKRLLTP